MQYRWQRRISCILIGIVSLLLLNQYTGWQGTIAAPRGVHGQRSGNREPAVAQSAARQPLPRAALAQDENHPDTPTIIGGKEAEPGAWPWMVALVYATSSDVKQGQFCGGALIAEQWVLSAAHCTFDLSGRPRQPTDIDIVIGRHQLSNLVGQRIRVTEIMRHPGYTESNFDNDLALLHLEMATTYPPIELLQPAQHSQEAAGTLTTVIGWGITDAGQDSDLLHQVDVPLVDLKTCRQSYGIFNNKVTDNMLCAGLKDGGKDSCQGDSGGPLMVFDTIAQRWQQLGIVSWGEGCAQPNYYGVYTRVSSYTAWISEQIPTLATPAPTSTPTATPTASATPTTITTAQSTATPTSTATVGAMSTPTSTFIATAPATQSPTPTSTIVPTATMTPPTGKVGQTIYLPMITMDQFYALQNGDFETNEVASWQEFSLQGRPLIINTTAGTVARSGSHLVQLGDTRNEVAFVEQKITIAATTPILEIWVQIESSDDCGYDFGGVIVNEQIAAQFDLCRATATTEWQRKLIDLHDYVGGTITLGLRAETDGFLDSVAFFDDVTLVAADAIAPLTANAPAHGIIYSAAHNRHNTIDRIWLPAER